MWWFPPAILVATGLLVLSWTAFLLIEITKAVELVVEAAVSLSSRRHAKNGPGALHRGPVVRHQPEWCRPPSVRKISRARARSPGRARNRQRLFTYLV